MVRIRYVTSNEANGKTELMSKSITSKGSLLRSRIARESLHDLWKVVVEKLVLKESTPEWIEHTPSRFTRSLAVAKVKAKLLMKEAGVEFFEEVRRRRSSDG